MTSFAVTAIGKVESPLTQPESVPRQPDEGAPAAWLVFEPAVAVDELHDVDESDLGQLRALETDLALLLAEEDLEEIGKVLEPGNIAAVLVYENSWAAPFASAVRRSGGQLVADGRVHTQALLAAIEAEEESERVGA